MITIVAYIRLSMDYVTLSILVDKPKLYVYAVESF